MRIGINCGHTVSGQPGCGAVGYLNESDETRRVGKKLIELLRGEGHTVYDCTNDYADTTLENLSEIVRMANAQPLDLFVSVHFNAGGGKGCEVYTYGGKSFGEAERTCEAISKLGFKNRGVKDGSSLYVIRHTTAKAMLVEVCFTDSASDAELYEKVGCEAVAAAIAGAITGQTVTKKESEGLTMTQYEELKSEIDGMKPMIYDYIDDNMPSWAKGTVQKLKDKGFLRGDENGRLGLTLEMMRTLVILDNAKAFG